MSIGASGRVVVEVDPDLKKELHATLIRDGLTLKDWFVMSAKSYLTHTSQIPLDFDSHKSEEAANEAL